MYIQKELGTGPFIITVPHDGHLRMADTPVRTEVARWERLFGRDPRDVGTLAIAQECGRVFVRDFAVTPTVISVRLHRAYLDVNRAPGKQPAVAGFQGVYEAFHFTLQQAIRENIARFGCCHLLDLHGYWHSPGPQRYDVVIGTDSHRTCSDGSDLHLAAHLRSRMSSQHGRPYTVVFSPDPVGDISGRYRGGWIVRNAAAQFGLHGCNAIQLELNEHMRVRAICPSLATDLAHAWFHATTSTTTSSSSRDVRASSLPAL